MNWKVSRAFTTIGSGTTPKSDDASYYDDGTINWLITGDVNDGEIKNIDRKITAKALSDYSALHIYPVGSIVITMYGAIGKIGMLTEPSTVNQACCVLVPGKNVFPKYALHYFLATRHQLIELGVGGVQSNVSQDIIKSLRISLPSVEMQRNIALYLDRKVSIIDKIIAAKNHTHTHLLELRQAIITDAVLGRGSVVMRRRLKTVVDMIISKRFAQSGDRIVTLENVDSWNGRIVRYADHESVSGELLEFKKGDVVFNKLRPYLAKVFFAREAGLCTSEMLILRPKTNIINPEYLFYFMLADRTISEINNSTYGVKMPRTNWEFVGSIYIDIPSLQEQQNIVVKVGGLLSKIDDSINELQRSTELLTEYRSSLISNVISGKVEV